MRLDRKLNFVIPVETAKGIFYVHAMPIGRETFSRYHLILAQTFTAVYTQGVTLVAGPRIAAMMLQSIAESSGVWEGPEGVENGLLAEIHRLANVVMPTDTGWRSVPLQDALDKKVFDQEDVDEVEGLLVFFTLASAMHKRSELEPVLTYVAKTWTAQISSLSCSDFAKSLPTSTATDSSGEKAKASSIPV